ncbi:beta strand repeat-containing protein [Candidatus Finniella inopinata]|uniref:Uncharacterized protein n=1 Tax=Candidatus Finniella inopinata TaxID=1696036 RepID=A0A4Q7DG44_9PROT|nr:hypothetical protein [Candidatus Finniella inopinata]RZI45811.1 hypothetical protein EQU50_05085 [Candidatus Finniella inopinata]
MGLYFIFLVFFFGLGGASASNVQLDGDASRVYPTINGTYGHGGGVRAANNGTHTFTLLNPVQSETDIYPLASFDSLTINSAQTNGTTIQPAAGFSPNSLFSSLPTSALTLSNVTIQNFTQPYIVRFATGFAGAMYSGEALQSVTLSGLGSVIFSGNTNTNCGNGGAIVVATPTVTLNAVGTLTFVGNKSTGPLFSGPTVLPGVGDLTLNANAVVTFTNNSAIGSGSEGGAIWTENSFTLNGIGPVIFTGNIAGLGGAIYSNGNIALQGSGQVTFANNSAVNAGSKGGAIYCGGELRLTDVLFSVNSAASGGAVYMNGLQGFTFTVSSGKTITLAGSTASGNNDIACNPGSAGDFAWSTFINDGVGALVLNTNNNSWFGNTTVTAGTLTVGDTAGNGAVWGSTPNGGTLTVNKGATLTVGGTVNTQSAYLAGGWTILLGNGATCGLLNVAGTLDVSSLLPANFQIRGTIPTATNFPSNGYTVAKYTNLTGSLDSINASLRTQNFFLDNRASPNSVILRSMNYALTSPTSAQATLVTFVVPGIYFTHDQTKNSNTPTLQSSTPNDFRSLTNAGEGLMIQCAPASGSLFNVILTQNWVDSFQTDGSRVNVGVGDTDPNVAAFGNSFTWTGNSAAFLPGVTYNYSLYKTTPYQSTTINPSSPAPLLTGTISNLTPTNLARTYQLQVLWTH